MPLRIENQLINFVQIHREQQKDGFYLYVVFEVNSFQINIIQKQQKIFKFYFFHCNHTLYSK